jgi:predicted permease
LIRIGRTRPELPGVLLPISPANLRDIKPQITTLSAFEAETPRSLVVNDDEGASAVSANAMTTGLFELLGVAPQLGRTFLPSDGDPDEPAVVVVSNEFWRTRLASDPDAIGSTLRLNDEPHTVIGVMPTGFTFARASLWVPLRFTERNYRVRNSNYLRLHGRLGATPLNQTITELHSLWTQLGGQYTDTYDESGMSAIPLLDAVVERSRRPLLVLGGAVGFVLLIACANVANLILARAEGRTREMAVRTALGAARGRLARQLFTETVVISLLGGLVGVAVAFVGVRILLASFANAVPRTGEIGVNGTVLVFSLVVSLVTGIAVGLVPALQSKPDHSALKEGARGGSARISTFRKTLVVSEVALALMLVVGAGLMLKSFWRAMQSDLGFDQNGVVIANLWFPPDRYQDRTAQAAFTTNLTDMLVANREVESVGMVNMVPIRSFGNNFTRISVAGEPDREASFVENRQATPEYFATMGIPLIRGRLLTNRDTSSVNTPILINAELARQLFGDDDPLGRRLDMNSQPEIVGVVGDVRAAGPDERPRPTLYGVSTTASNLVVRARSMESLVMDLIRREAATLDPNVSVLRFDTMDDIISRSLGDRRFQITLIGIFAAAALILGAVGIYGVVAYAVQRQTREIGVRMALGARAGDVLQMVVWRGGRMALTGIAIGLIGAYLLREFVANMLFDVNAFDPMVYGGTGAILLGVALLACWVPAHRAAAVHPLEALRYE